MRVGVPYRLDLLRELEELLTARPNAAATDIVVFGEQEIRTGAAVVVPAEFDRDAIPGYALRWLDR